MGHVDLDVSLETVPLSPYFENRTMKFILEFLFGIVILKLAYTEFREIRGRKSRRKALAVWMHKEDVETESTIKPFIRSPVIRAWLGAVHEHYFGSEQPISNFVDLATVGLGIALGVLWLLLVKHCQTAEDALEGLRRPNGAVAYDDTDADAWSIYHHDVVFVQDSVETVIKDMVTMMKLAFHVFLILVCDPTTIPLTFFFGTSATISSHRVLHGPSFGVANVQNLG